MERTSTYMHTASGKKYWPIEPKADDVNIETITHHLATRCRYNGAVQNRDDFSKIFYSVAEHSVYCSYFGPAEEALERLLHDASEAYNGDLIRPLKKDKLFAEPFKIVEERNEQAVALRFNLQFPHPPSVKPADEAVTAAECLQIVPRDPNEEWESGKLHDDSKVAQVKIKMFDPFAAKLFFSQRFLQLWDMHKNQRIVPKNSTDFGCQPL